MPSGVYIRSIEKQRIVLICQCCGEKFKVVNSRRNAKYCSQKCMGKYMRISCRGLKYSKKTSNVKREKNKSYYMKKSKKIYNNSIWLYQELVGKKQTLEEVANVCKCTTSTILFFARYYNIPINSRCKDCGKLIKRGKKKCFDCIKKHEQKYQKQKHIKRRALDTIQNIVAGFTHSIGLKLSHDKEMINCRKEYYGDNWDKLKLDFYILLFFFSLLIRYNDKCKLLMKKIELEEKQRKEKIQKGKDIRKQFKLQADGDKKEYQRLLFNYNMNNAYKRNKKDLFYRLNLRMSRLIYYSLKQNKNSKHWESLVNFSLEDLKKYLEKTMPQNYTWEDFQNGNKLHIDHIIPQCAFIFKSPEDEEFKMCWSLYNLRLLPTIKNIKKNRNFDNPILLWLLIKELSGKS